MAGSRYRSNNLKKKQQPGIDLITTLRLSFASIACAAVIAGCATNEQGQLVIDPNKVNAVLASALTPPPPPPPPPVVIEEAYEPMPTDIYVSTIVDHDVVFVGGDTFIWYVGPDGVRRRHFYAHGDRRVDVFRRREELHAVIANHGGRLPDHAIAARGPAGHPNTAVAHATVASKPAPSKPVAKDTNKS